MKPLTARRPNRGSSALSRGLSGTLCALGLALPALGFGCASTEGEAETALDYTDNAKRDYDAALAAVEDKNWQLATELLNEVKRKYAYSRYARLAELRLADASFQQDKFAEAISGYKEFVHDHPNDPEVPYARYRVAKGEYESVSQSIMLPPLEERDLASVNDALNTLRNYLSDYPRSEHAEELRYMLDVVLGLLARHELYVARFYLNQGRFDAAVMRCEYALKNLKSSGLEPEALVLLGEIYMKQKRRKDAREVLTRLLTDYPESAFAVPAKNFLAQLDKT
ncbi:MAG: Competence protein ComL precursor [Polyangiaceae bacterium]|jgi:outer membrane protein assembly factor BamD|nr:Competence protein ComL precursor [Polyangiaceae bacterium]